MAYTQDHEAADLKYMQTTSAGAEGYGETTGLSRDEKDMIRMGKVQETKVCGLVRQL